MTEENKVILDTDKLPNFADTFIDLNTYKRLEQENKDFEILAKSLYKRIEELEKENEALVFREILYKADYEASEQENKALQAYKDINEDFKKAWDELNEKYKQLRSALEEIKTVLKFYADSWVDEKIYPDLHYDNTKAKEGLSRINEVLK